MICREIWRAEVIIAKNSNDNDVEAIKDEAWATFDAEKKADLEQENYTKVEFHRET